MPCATPLATAYERSKKNLFPIPIWVHGGKMWMFLGGLCERRALSLFWEVQDREGSALMKGSKGQRPGVKRHFLIARSNGCPQQDCMFLDLWFIPRLGNMWWNKGSILKGNVLDGSLKIAVVLLSFCIWKGNKGWMAELPSVDWKGLHHAQPLPDYIWSPEGKDMIFQVTDKEVRV